MQRRLVIDIDNVFELRQPRAERLQQRLIVVLKKAPHRDQHAAVGMAEEVFELARGRPGVYADGHPAEQQDGEVGDHPFRAVAHQDRHLVAAAHAERVQRARDAAHFAA